MLVGHYVYGGALFLLRNLKWVECDEGSYTMYLEMMISFQLVTGMEIPVAVPGIKQLVYQSPSVDCRLAKHHSTTGALQAFINSIHTTLRVTGEDLLPEQIKQHTCRRFVRIIRKTSLKAKALLPEQKTIDEILNKYLLDHDGYKITTLFKVPSKNFEQRWLQPHDLILLPGARQRNFASWQSAHRKRRGPN